MGLDSDRGGNVAGLDQHAVADAPRPDSQATCPTTSSGTRIALTLAWGTGLSLALLLEASRIRERLIHVATVGDWTGNPQPDGTFMLPWLALAPLCWLYRLPARTGTRNFKMGNSPRATLAASCLLVAAVAWGAAAWTGGRPFSASPAAESFASRTPAIHDEFSYLLQARTILAGRWTWDGPPRAPELFHQMHVLNDGRFAARYLPGTGAWIAPWLWLGRPILGHWVAHVIVSVGMFLIGRRIAGTIAGLTAGLLTALSPGMVLFANLLLSHHPTLVCVTLFLGAFLRFMDDRDLRFACPAGFGLAGAMLCRPLTAAAIGLPFGLWWVGQGIRSLSRSADFGAGKWFLRSLALAGPLVLGFAIVGWQNLALTGEVGTTAYSRYNELYAPYQRYGFHNRSPSDVPLPETVLKDYNDWARNLDGRLARENAWNRLRAGLEWTLGLVPLTMALIVAGGTFFRQPREIRLLLSAIVSLHVFHVPYWLDGILHHHYVFEAAPLLLLILAAVSADLLRTAIRERRCLFPIWWGGLLILAVGVNHVRIGQGTTTPRIHQGMASLTHATDRYRRFQEALRAANLITPAVVLVQKSPGDLHVEYVRNDPPFDAELMVGIDRPELYGHAAVQALFPERALYLYHADTAQLTRYGVPSESPPEADRKPDPQEERGR